MLTLEQIAEGRRLRGARLSSGSWARWQDWLTANAEALLDAAERVARQELYANEPDGYDSWQVHEAWAARLKATELEAECWAEFKHRPLVARGAYATNPHAFGPELVEAWYASRGVIVRVDQDPSDLSRLKIDPLRLRR